MACLQTGLPALFISSRGSFFSFHGIQRSQISGWNPKLSAGMRTVDIGIFKPVKSEL